MTILLLRQSRAAAGVLLTLPVRQQGVADVSTSVARGKGEGKARGYGARTTVEIYYAAAVRGIDGKVVGKIIINTHPKSESLDAHCNICDCRINKKYRQHKNRPSHQQGRPMGSHLAWLCLKCLGDASSHRAMWDAAELPFVRKAKARTEGSQEDELQPCFAVERDTRPEEIADGGEPRCLA